jgi:hypothetical protein
MRQFKCGSSNAPDQKCQIKMLAYKVLALKRHRSAITQSAQSGLRALQT